MGWAECAPFTCLFVVLSLSQIYICSPLALHLPSSASVSISDSGVAESYNSSNLLNVTARNPDDPYCSGLRYGYDLKAISCENAWNKIDRSTRSIRYIRHRSPASSESDVQLPMRYLSDDGICAIDIVLDRWHAGPLRGWDISTGLMISEKAHRLLNECVGLRHGEGGKIGHFSKSENFSCRSLTEFDLAIDTESSVMTYRY